MKLSIANLELLFSHSVIVLNYPFKTLCLFIKLLLFSFIIVSLWVDIYFIACFDIHSFLYSLWENMMKFIIIWN